MFLHYRTQGFILNKTNRGEADRIFTIYTKDFGKLDLLAKAERKIESKLRAGLEVFYLSEIEFIQGKTHKTLTDAVLIKNFKNLRGDLKKLKVAHQISDLMDNLVKGEEPDSKIWQLLIETFETLNSSSVFNLPSSMKMYYYFLWNLLSVLGYQVELYYCSICQKKIVPRNISFSPKEGGLIGKECQDKVKSLQSISSDTVKILRIILRKDLVILRRLKIDDPTFNELKRISNYYLSGVLEQIK